ncbi:MAG TPA: hypothetical protein VNB59_03565 [Solirubrobacterales bacterium]|jgi:hypothetical protein|nr:hypothetical protein [Solirubrobacterales bacterium]
MAGRRLSYTEREAREAIAASYSWAESLRKLGLCPSGGAWRVLKKYADLWGISTDHFDPAKCVEGNLRLPARRLDEVLVENSTYSRQHVKRRLFKEGMKEPKCEMCGQDEIWHGRAMGMILDHINGVRSRPPLEESADRLPELFGHLGHPLWAKEQGGKSEKIVPPLWELVRRGASGATLLLAGMWNSMGQVKASRET